MKTTLKKTLSLVLAMALALSCMATFNKAASPLSRAFITSAAWATLYTASALE